MNIAYIAAFGILVGVGAALSGLGGGFLMVPFLLWLGYEARAAVGTSFLAILIISISACLAHGRLANIDYRVGLGLAIGGAIGAQVGAVALSYIPTAVFRKLFSFILMAIALRLFFQR